MLPVFKLFELFPFKKKKKLSSQGNTLFTCYVCDRSFLSSEELTQHQPTHSKDDKPFKCVHCKESFKTFSEVSRIIVIGSIKTKCRQLSQTSSPSYSVTLL